MSVKIPFFNVEEGFPEYIPILEDYRNFLFVDEQGGTYSGFYIGDGVFVDENRNIYPNIAAWVEWEETSE